MTTDGTKLVVIDGRVTNEKLAELLDLQTEHPALDFKAIIDLTGKPGLIELAKDVGAFQVSGGYIIGGVDDHGVPNGAMDDCSAALFDEANLVPQLLRYLPEPLNIHSRVAEWKAHKVVIIFVGPNPDGYAVFKAVGQYRKSDNNDDMKVVFRDGEIFWRDGTRSVRISQRGLREVLERQIEARRVGWIAEHQEILRREREEMTAGAAARDLARAPLGTMNLGFPADEIRLGVLELIRARDSVALRWLLNDARPRARSAINRDKIDSELADLLCKLTAVAAVGIEYEQDDLLNRAIHAFSQIYSMPLVPHDDQAFGYSTSIDPKAKAPQVFLAVLQQVYALGALAVRLKRWEVVRRLTLVRPDSVGSYWTNWLRHGLTMASRAQHFTQAREDGSVIELSLLTLAAQAVERAAALHPDTDDSEAILTSLARFDFLSNLAAVDGAGSADSKVFYTSWARFRQERIQPVADRLVDDPALRNAIFSDQNDRELAHALSEVAAMARSEGFRYDGFWGWHGTPVGDFINATIGDHRASRQA